MELKIDKQCRGVRIIAKEEAAERRRLLDDLISIAHDHGFNEMVLPSIEPAEIYVDKAGQDVLGRMYVFQDSKLSCRSWSRKSKWSAAAATGRELVLPSASIGSCLREEPIPFAHDTDVTNRTFNFRHRD